MPKRFQCPTLVSIPMTSAPWWHWLKAALNPNTFVGAHTTFGLVMDSDMSTAVDAVFCGLPQTVPQTLDLQRAYLPNSPPYYGSPWLCFVIRHATNNEVEFVRNALDAGADPNEPHTARGCVIYPLHLAVKHGLPDVVKLLLDRGALRNALTSCNRHADDFFADLKQVELDDTIAEMKAVLNL